jgi:PAS domain S-box-containing protein
MQTFYKRFSVFTGFAALMVLLAGNAFVLRRQMGIQIERQTWVLHTRLVLSELQQIESLLANAETGQRGFLYTGDAKYLAPFEAAVSQVDPHLDRLAQLTADNPREQARIPELRGLCNKKLAELAQTVLLNQSGKPEEARAIVLSDAGLVYMNQIRQIVAQMNQEEDSLETLRRDSYEQSVKRTIASVYLASGIAAVGLVLLGWYILREMEIREKHAQEIRAREEWFRITLTSIGDAVIATDRHGKVTFINPVAEALTGTNMANAAGKDVQEVFPIFNEFTQQAAENPVRKVMSLGCVVGLANHTVLQHADGTLLPIEDSAAPIRDDRGELIGVVLVFRDVTKERQSQEVLRKTEKLAAAARLSATVAHEINNPLEAIVNLVYIAKVEPDVPDSVIRHLTLAEQELERVAHITRQTLGFYRESNTPERIEIQALIDSVLKLYSNKLRTKEIVVVRDFGPCPPVLAAPGALEQIVSNLISNAADAVDTHGTIRVKVHCREEATGSVVELVIEDDGPGIAAEHMGRIFEPFYTTKKDVGTGLGLWVTKELVERLGGTVNVGASSINRTHGAAFTINLPVALDGRDNTSATESTGA